MLPKEFRLTGERNFKRVYQKGEFWQGKFLKIISLPSRFSSPRFGFVISTKALALASGRNLLKRKLRHKALEYLKEAAGAPSFDVIVLAKRGIKKEEFTAIIAELEQWLKKSFLA